MQTSKFTHCGPLCFYFLSQNLISHYRSIWTTLRSLDVDEYIDGKKVFKHFYYNMTWLLDFDLILKDNLMFFMFSWLKIVPDNNNFFFFLIFVKLLIFHCQHFWWWFCETFQKFHSYSHIGIININVNKF